MCQKEPNQTNEELEGEEVEQKKCFAAIGIEATDTESQCLKHLKIASLHPIYECLPHTNI